MSDRKPIKRRIASDDAHSWARNLELGNPYAKSILRAVALYVNEQGIGWPGAATLSRDTDIAEDTVIKRLKWLEEIGAIALFKAWIDDNGQRNREGRGRPTSFDIAFLMDADTDEIEARANGAVKPLRGAAKTAHKTATISPRPGQAQTEDAAGEHPGSSDTLAPGQPPVSPMLAPAPGGMNLEPESEVEQDSPQKPPEEPGGLSSEQPIEEASTSDPDGLAEFLRTYPKITNKRALVKSLWTGLSPEERGKNLRGAQAANRYYENTKPKPSLPSPEKFIGEGVAESYLERAPAAAVPASEPRYVPMDSPEGKAWAVLHKVGRLVPMGVNLARGECYVLKTTLDARALACAEAPTPKIWFAPENSQQAAAWREFATEAIGKPANTPSHVPWPWPPRKDGGIYSGDDKLMTAEDERVIAEG
jgi:hypothetical protein